MNRRREPEWMDEPDIDASLHAHALGALNRVNRWLAWDWAMCRHVRRLLRKSAGRPAVLDLGAGGGGFLSYVAARLSAAAPIAVDRSPFALARSREWSGGSLACVAADGRRLPFGDREVPVVACSLFLHHFDEADAVAILREAGRVAGRGIIVGDLSRSRLAWWLTWLVTRLVSRSPVFRIDGPRSVRAAYRPVEALSLARRAGLHEARVAWYPFRWILIWQRPEPDP